MGAASGAAIMKRARHAKHKPMRGLGDAVARLAEPVASLLDRTLGTHWQGCAGCAGRQQWLNEKVPFQKTPTPENTLAISQTKEE